MKPVSVTFTLFLGLLISSCTHTTPEREPSSENMAGYMVSRLQWASPQTDLQCADMVQANDLLFMFRPLTPSSSGILRLHPAKTTVKENCHWNQEKTGPNAYYFLEFKPMTSDLSKLKVRLQLVDMDSRTLNTSNPLPNDLAQGMVPFVNWRSGDYLEYGKRLTSEIAVLDCKTVTSGFLLWKREKLYCESPAGENAKIALLLNYQTSRYTGSGPMNPTSFRMVEEIN